jgi:hypothetical protein
MERQRVIALANARPAPDAPAPVNALEKSSTRFDVRVTAETITCVSVSHDHPPLFQLHLRANQFLFCPSKLML